MAKDILDLRYESGWRKFILYTVLPQGIAIFLILLTASIGMVVFPPDDQPSSQTRDMLITAIAKVATFSANAKLICYASLGVGVVYLVGALVLFYGLDNFRLILVGTMLILFIVLLIVTAVLFVIIFLLKLSLTRDYFLGAIVPTFLMPRLSPYDKSVLLHSVSQFAYYEMHLGCCGISSLMDYKQHKDFATPQSNPNGQCVPVSCCKMKVNPSSNMLRMIDADGCQQEACRQLAGVGNLSTILQTPSAIAPMNFVNAAGCLDPLYQMLLTGTFYPRVCLAVWLVLAALAMQLLYSIILAKTLHQLVQTTKEADPTSQRVMQSKPAIQPALAKSMMDIELSPDKHAGILSGSIHSRNSITGSVSSHNSDVIMRPNRPQRHY